MVLLYSYYISSKQIIAKKWLAFCEPELPELKEENHG